MLSKRIAGDCVAFCAVWLCWTVLAPIVAGPIIQPLVLHNCPAPRTIHGVGADLRTYAKRVDQCLIAADQYRLDSNQGNIESVRR